MAAQTKFFHPQHQSDKVHALLQAIDTIGVSTKKYPLTLADFIATYAFDPESLDETRLREFEDSLSENAIGKDPDKQSQNSSFMGLLDLAIFYHLCKLSTTIQNFSMQFQFSDAETGDALSSVTFEDLYNTYKDQKAPP